MYAVKEDVNVIAEIGTDCDGKDDLQFTPVPAKTLTYCFRRLAGLTWLNSTVQLES